MKVPGFSAIVYQPEPRKDPDTPSLPEPRSNPRAPRHRRAGGLSALRGTRKEMQSAYPPLTAPDRGGVWMTMVAR